MKLLHNLKTLSLLGVIGFCAGTANAAQVVINNPSFEAPALGSGVFQSTPPSGWTIVGGLTAMVVWNPAASYPNLYFNSPPPEGQQVLALGANFSSGEVIQNLGVTLQPNTLYTLTFRVGARNDIPISSYNVELIAGNTVLVSDHQANPPAGGFVSRTLTFHSGTMSGGALSIDLRGNGRNYADGVSGQVILDLIQLDASPDVVQDFLTLACPATTGHVGVPYSSALVASGNHPSYTYSLSGGSLGGLVLDPATGAITGTPGAATVLNFTATVMDSSTPSPRTATADCSIGITDIATASFLATDNSTHGTWKGVYGGDGYMIAGDSTALPAYAQLSLAGQLPYTWLNSTQDITCLQKGAPQSTDRLAAVWYSSTFFTIDVTVAGPAQRVALYAVDWDGAGRVERIDVIDAGTGTTIDTRQISGFGQGTYLVWNIAGHVQFKVTTVGGVNSIISGVLLGGSSGGPAIPANITQNPANVSVNAGLTATFSIAATGSSLTYQWQVQPSGGASFANIAGAVSATYTTPTLALTDSGAQFRCVATNSLGSATSSAATLTVVAGPAITQNPANASANVGQTASFTVAATGTGLTYQWQKQLSGGSFANIGGATSTSYTTTALVAADNGAQFRCVVTNANGFANSNAATLTVISPPSITSNPANSAATTGQSASFTVGASGLNLTYQWQSQPSGGSFANITGANSATYTTPVLALGDNGKQFRCVVTNGAGFATSTAATLTVTLGSTNSATFVSSDSSTKGSWKGVYGPDGFLIASDTTSLPGYGQVSFAGQLPFVWDPSNQDPTCLQKGAPSATDRIASVWYSSTFFSIDVNVSGGSHQIGLYALDWDRAQRIERIDVFDASTGIQLDSREVSGFSTGTYMLWNISGHVQFRVYKVAGPNAVISGIFFGAGQGVVIPPSISQNPVNASVNVGQTASFSVVASGSALTYQWQSQANGAPSFSNINGATGATYTTPVLNASDSGTQYRCVVTNSANSATSTAASVTVSVVQTSASAVFVNADTTTQGAWKSTYGADGYSITSLSDLIPAYAQVALPGSSIWTSGLSNDPRAVQSSPGLGETACWYSSPQFAVDLNLTDANTHRIAFYFVDWGGASRNQTVTIRDWQTGVVLDSKPLASFVNGEYLVWNIKGHVTVTVSANSGPNAVLSAIFFQ